jgi:glutamyl-tRNA synthetase
MTSLPRGRYAPSPTGELHLGNASSALLAWLSIRSRGGSFVMRMEDLDRNRVRPGLAEQILQDLVWLGLDWDEGSDRGGAHGPYEQWARLDRYEAAFERMRAAGQVYPCFCSRKDVAAAASAPQALGDEVRYPGTCRGVDPAEAARRVSSGDRHAWRFRVAPGRPPGFTDLVRGARQEDLPPGDFVVYRADGVPAYQLAVVVDDAAMGITEVVRGDDLLPSTVKQLLLIDALALEVPVYGHVPLLLGTDGIRLSKRHRGVTLRELREGGASPEEIIGRLIHLLGLRPEPLPLSAGDLVDGFHLVDLAPAPDGIVIDTRGWSEAGLGSTS